jgi:hypothetical protein
MAIKLTSLSETFEVAVFADDALDMTREQYVDYIKTCDKSKLICHEGKTPTFFVVKKVLRYDDSKRLRSKQVSYKDDHVYMDSSFTIEEVRLSLCGVINPPDLPQEHHIVWKTIAGGAADDLMAYLVAVGAVDDIYLAKQYISGAKTVDADKKK